MNIFKLSRESEELSIRQAAREIGCSPTTVQKVEQSSDVRISTLHKFCVFYDLNFGAAVTAYWFH